MPRPAASTRRASGARRLSARPRRARVGQVEAPRAPHVGDGDDRRPKAGGHHADDLVRFAAEMSDWPMTRRRRRSAAARARGSGRRRAEHWEMSSSAGTPGRATGETPSTSKHRGHLLADERLGRTRPGERRLPPLDRGHRVEEPPGFSSPRRWASPTPDRSAARPHVLPHHHQPVGLRIGQGRSSRAFTTLKIAVFAPMPSASVAIATSAKPGDRVSMPAGISEVLKEGGHRQWS